jgi:hypothetical protein
MTDNDKEPIDLLKWRFDKMMEQERRQEEAEDNTKQLEWSRTKLADEIEAIDLSEEVLKGVKTFMCTIAKRVKEVRSIREVERLFFGLGLLLLRDYDRVAFDRLLKMMQDEQEKK